MARLLSIGRFARLSGLSIDALRHYGELGLLRPASVDDQTGYRRYSTDQLGQAQAVARLRALDVPLAKVAAYLAAESPDAARRVLTAHLADVEARTARNQLTMHGLRRIIDQKEDLVNTTAVAPDIDRDTRRRLAVDLFNHTWQLLETEGRTVEQDDEMVHGAHASRYHWGEVGDASNLARGEWQCARVYSVLGRGEPALHHAGRCLEICQKNGIGDWDLAAAYEAMARASRVAGDDAARLRFLALARDACEDIADPEDRKIIESDLATLALSASALPSPTTAR